jgi:hypothetical protein
MNTKDYYSKMKDMLNKLAYKVLQNDPTNKIERKTATFIRKLKISRDITKKLILSASVPLRVKGLLKIHKGNLPLRPIVNCIGSSTYLLAKHLPVLLGQFVGLAEHHTKISASFIPKLRTIYLQKTNILASFNMVSLFTKVPLNDTLQLLEQHFKNKMMDLFQ